MDALNGAIGGHHTQFGAVKSEMSPEFYQG